MESILSSLVALFSALIAIISVSPVPTAPPIATVIEQVATHSAVPRVDIPKPTPEKPKRIEQKAQKAQATPQPLVLTEDEPKSAQVETQKSETFTTPSGAVIDASGNVLYTPPQQPRPSQTYTLPLPKGSVIDESGNVLYVPPPEKNYVCRTENTSPRIPLVVKELPWGEYGAFTNKNAALIQQFATRAEAVSYAEANGEIDKSKDKSVCGWE